MIQCDIHMKIAPYYKELLKDIEVQIERAHPATYIGMFDCGKNYMFRLLATEELSVKDTLLIPIDLSSNDVVKAFQVGSLLFRSSVDISNLEQMWNEIHLLAKNKSVVLVFNLPYGESPDSSFFDTLYSWKNLLRDKLNWIVFTNYGILNSQVSSKSTFGKIILSKVVPILPLDADSSQIIIDNYSEYFGKIPVKYRMKIITLSGGNPGFIKSLYLLAQQNKLEDWRNDEQLLVRIKKIINDLSPKEIDTLSAVVDGKVNTTQTYIQMKKFGYITGKNKVFSPLLIQILNQRQTAGASDFSSTQLKVFNLLREKAPHIVSRDEIAQVMWGSRWAQDYSDWALDQMIHEVRNKLEKGKSSWILQTKKILVIF